jgi:hypothetical protein
LFLLVLLLPPLGLYLMVLGWVNRRRRPVLMAGTWEFVGVLFALSGFILVGGPAFLGSLDERSRWFWLLGQADTTRYSGGAWMAWVAVRVAYFVVVAAVAIFALWRGRRLTSIYNIDTQAIVTAIEQALERLGFHVLRSGDSFIVGDRADKAGPKAAGSEGIHAAARAPAAAPASSGSLAAPAAALRVEVFPLMRHATLHWDPADSPTRREVEKEVAHALAEAAPPEQQSLLGGCLTLIGVMLFVLTFIAGGLLLLFRFYPLR